jgi:hypothetical protein
MKKMKIVIRRRQHRKHRSSRHFEENKKGEINQRQPLKKGKKVEHQGEKRTRYDMSNDHHHYHHWKGEHSDLSNIITLRRNKNSGERAAKWVNAHARNDEKTPWWKRGAIRTLNGNRGKWSTKISTSATAKTARGGETERHRKQTRPCNVE